MLHFDFQDLAMDESKGAGERGEGGILNWSEFLLQVRNAFKVFAFLPVVRACVRACVCVCV